MSQSEKSRGVLLYTPNAPRALPSRSINGAIRADSQTQLLHQLGPLHARIGDQIERLGRFARQHGGAEQAAVAVARDRVVEWLRSPARTASILGSRGSSSQMAACCALSRSQARSINSAKTSSGVWPTRCAVTSSMVLSSLAS